MTQDTFKPMGGVIAALTARLDPKAPPRVITSHVYPPIPIRTCDWCAWYDGDEPNDDG